MKTVSGLYILISALLVATGVRADDRLVRMGIFEASPLVFAADGEAQGLYVDILEAVAAEEGWRVQYVHGTWEEHRPAVEAGMLDLLPAIAYTASRDSVLDFTGESILTVWSQVYVREGVEVRHVLDLDRRTVAMLAGDINRSYLQDLARESGARITIREFPTQEEVFAATARGEVDAGVATNVFGYLNATGYGLVGSPMVFAPFSMRYATAEGANGEVLAAIDRALVAWHLEDDSFYFQRLNHWYGSGRFQREIVPHWVPIVAAVVVCLLALLVLWNRTLNLRVRSRTQALEQSKERFRLLFETAGDAIFLMGGNRFIECNARTLEVFGCTREEIIGHTPAEFSPPEQPDGTDSAPSARKRIEAAMAGELQFFEWRHLRADGMPFDAEVTLTLLESGGQRFLQAIVRDITERKRLESDLRQAHKMEAIGTLAGGIAHDFNNILSAILGYGELAGLEADKTSRGAEIRAHVDQVILAGERARDLVQQILAFSRRSMESRRPLDLARMIEETLRLLRSTIPATIGIRHDLGACRPVFADPTGVHQILMNLCTNAFQAMSRQGGEIKVTLVEREHRRAGGNEEELPTGSYAVIEVSDTGPGMSPEVAGKIFEPYFTTKSPDRGTGLGLAVVHGIVEDHDGRITLETAPGEGTCIRVWLPVVDEADTGPSGVGSGEETARGDERILLVDDEPGIVHAAVQGLGDLGYRVTGCTDPDAALAAFRSAPETFDIVVTDMTMSGMTGADFMRAILEMRPEIPVILCTGYSEEVTRDSVLALGARAFLMKPVTPSRLAAEVRAVLDEVVA